MVYPSKEKWVGSSLTFIKGSFNARQKMMDGKVFLKIIDNFICQKVEFWMWVKIPKEDILHILWKCINLLHVSPLAFTDLDRSNKETLVSLLSKWEIGEKKLVGRTRPSNLQESTSNRHSSNTRYVFERSARYLA